MYYFRSPERNFVVLAEAELRQDLRRLRQFRMFRVSEIVGTSDRRKSRNLCQPISHF